MCCKTLECLLSRQIIGTGNNLKHITQMKLHELTFVWLDLVEPLHTDIGAILLQAHSGGHGGIHILVGYIS